jgi:type III secretion protein W
MDRKTFRAHFNFEIMAKLFFDLAEERYPSAEKIKQLVSQLVVPLTNDPYESLHVQIAILNVIRNMVKEVSPNQLYRSLQHRDDLYMAIIEASEDLEDALEELEEKLLEEEELEE